MIIFLPEYILDFIRVPIFIVEFANFDFDVGYQFTNHDYDLQYLRMFTDERLYHVYYVKAVHKYVFAIFHNKYYLMRTRKFLPSTRILFQKEFLLSMFINNHFFIF